MMKFKIGDICHLTKKAKERLKLPNGMKYRIIKITPYAFYEYTLTPIKTNEKWIEIFKEDELRLVKTNEESTDNMSKRFYAACTAMQGLLSFYDYEKYNMINHAQNIVENAYKLADELLKQENDKK